MMVENNHAYLRVALVLTSLVIVGCGTKEANKPSLTPVTGTITLDGKALSDADIVFHYKGTAPEGYQDGASRSDEDGAFQVKSGDQLGVLPGLHKVTVTRSESAGQPSLPKKYAGVETTNLEVKVTRDRSIGYLLQLSTTSQ